MRYLSATVVCEGVRKVLMPWETFECYLKTISICKFFRTLLLASEAWTVRVCLPAKGTTIMKIMIITARPRDSTKD